MKSCLLLSVFGTLLVAVRINGQIGNGFDVDAIIGMFSGVAQMFTQNPTVDVNTDRLMGKWFQMYKAAINFDVFRTQMFCPVAYFSKNSVMGRGGFSMLEGYRVISKNGPIETYKRDVTKTAPGVFWMYTEEYFYPRQLSIIKVVPSSAQSANETEETESDYDYFIATDSNKLALMVFARDPVEFYERYNQDVLKFLESRGFGGTVFWNSPKPIYQGADCQWPNEQELFARRALKSHTKTTYNNQIKKQQSASKLNPVQALQGIFGGLQSIGKR